MDECVHSCGSIFCELICSIDFKSFPIFKAYNRKHLQNEIAESERERERTNIKVSCLR